ncbi:hypothetical protein HRS9139_10540, partial [Pyrenophora teres f. teres]
YSPLALVQAPLSMSEQATYHPLARDTEFGHQDNSSQTGVFIAEFSNDEVTFGKIPASNTPNKRYCICATTGVEHRIQSCDASDIAYSAFTCVKRVIFVNVDGTADMLRYNGSLYTVAFVPHALQVVCELVSTGFQGSEVVILTDFTAQAELQKHVLENFTCWCKGHDRNTDEHDMGDRLSGIQMFSMTDMQVVSNEVVIYCSTASNEFDRHHNQSNLFRASCVARSMVVIVGDVRDSNPTRHEYPRVPMLPANGAAGTTL